MIRFIMWSGEQVWSKVAVMSVLVMFTAYAIGVFIAWDAAWIVVALENWATRLLLLCGAVICICIAGIIEVCQRD